ncbi:MAG: hypothetical protein V7K38_21865 [Nostoc sp.]
MKKLALPPPKTPLKHNLRKRRLPLGEILIMSVETLWSDKLRTLIL